MSTDIDSMESKILILGCLLDKHLGLFKDLEKRNNVIVYYSCFLKIPNCFKLIRKIHLSYKINRIIRIPYKYVWYDYGKNLNSEDVKIIVVTNGAVDKINYHWIKSLKQKGIKVFLYLLDAMDGDSEVLKYCRPFILSNIWDDIYTFEPADQLKYGFKYLGFCYYSKQSFAIDRFDKAYDLFFAGGTKGGRSNIIHSIYQYLCGKNIICKFIVTLKKGEVGTDAGIEYIREWIPYSKVVIEEMKSRCVLEIVQKNQTGPTLRYFEAVCYNKKLITTNPHIVDFPYYNSNWMKIIQNAEDIDVKWLTNDDLVDYQYKDDFSPNNFVDYFVSL